MRVLVIGAGISGIATAYFLVRSGCDVTVVDREPGPADSTSFANGGVVGGTQVEPWAQPGLPIKLLGWLGREEAPVLIRSTQLPKIMDWGRRFLMCCRASAYHDAIRRNVRLTLLSLSEFAELRTKENMTGAEYDLSRRGAYKLFFSDADFAHARKEADSMASLGVEVEAIDAAAAADGEPALLPLVSRLKGALAFPREEIGDCRKFTIWLADRLRQDGVSFHYDTEVVGLRTENGRVVSATTAGGDVGADAFVLAQASHTPTLLRPLGIKIPIIPVKGVSVTVPAEPWEGALRSAVMDHSRLFGLMRIGDHLRVSGSAEVAGYDAKPSLARCQALIDSVTELFPAFADCVAAGPPLYWAGLRGNTPDGVPVIGKTAVPNLFLNAGHGPEGWSTSCGAARMVSDLVIGNAPAIDTKDYALSRF